MRTAGVYQFSTVKNVTTTKNAPPKLSFATKLHQAIAQTMQTPNKEFSLTLIHRWWRIFGHISVSFALQGYQITQIYTISSVQTDRTHRL